MKNSTIKKLDRIEISELGLNNKGIYTYRGEIKSRIKGMKRTFNTADEIHFESDNTRVEIISIVSVEDQKEWAIRMFDKKKDSYMEFWPVLFGLEYIR